MHHCASQPKLVGGGVAAAEVYGFDQSRTDDARQANPLAYASISCPRALGKLSSVVMLDSSVAGGTFDLRRLTHRRAPRPDCGT